MKASLRLGALLMASMQCAACSFNMTTVRVKDAAHVALETPEGKPILPEGAAEAKVSDGEFWRPFEKVHYEIRGVREATGGISLKCDECTTQAVNLLDASGATHPTWSWRVAIEPEAVQVSYEDECLETHKYGCYANVPARLTIPMNNVVEVRRRVEPVRFIGYVLLGFSVLALGGLTYLAASNHDAAPFAGIAAIPPLAAGGIGLWQILAPTKEQVWTPSSDKQ